MDAINYSDFCKHLDSTLDRVNEDHIPIVVTRENGKPVVIMSLEDFNSYEETAYLMASPANAERLNKSIAEAKAGRVVQHDLIEEE
jgi:antitoxin YefM